MEKGSLDAALDLYIGLVRDLIWVRGWGSRGNNYPLLHQSSQYSDSDKHRPDTGSKPLQVLCWCYICCSYWQTSTSLKHLPVWILHCVYTPWTVSSVEYHWQIQPYCQARMWYVLCDRDTMDDTKTDDQHKYCLPQIRHLSYLYSTPGISYNVKDLLDSSLPQYITYFSRIYTRQFYNKIF